MYLKQKLRGSTLRSEVGEQNDYPRMMDYLWAASGSSTYGPTKTHEKSFENARKIFLDIKSESNHINELIGSLLIDLKSIKAPVVKE